MIQTIFKLAWFKRSMALISPNKDKGLVVSAALPQMTPPQQKYS
tara:strand:- start:223 stop:354 length:132 start_codon:yes stop_codon:yes gene_type:complete